MIQTYFYTKGPKPCFRACVAVEKLSSPDLTLQNDAKGIFVFCMLPAIYTVSLNGINRLGIAEET
jgi:hypothetical protein